jgi:serine/threonine protein kinase
MLGAGGQVHLMDFGIAGSAGAEHAVEGTPAYMAPEQLLGKGLTTQTDIYALGLIIHEIFGERLHIDDTLVDRGRVGFGVTMRGTIESGAGAGERITARSRCTSRASRAR